MMSYPTPQEHPVLALFAELLAVPSPSSREEALAELIRAKLHSYGYRPETDAAGNVLVRLPGRAPDGPLTCFAAHMDEIGMVVTRVGDDGTLTVERSGGLYPWKMGERPVTILGDFATVTGILSMGSAHGAGGDKAITWADVRVVTGLTPAQLARAGVRPGVVAVPTRDGRGPIVFGDPADPLVAAWTFDDRMGVVALLRMLEVLAREQRRPQHNTIVAFTVHEEGGCHGAKFLAQRERPAIFIAIDGCPIPAGAPLHLDGRPGIWTMDRGGHYDQGLVRALCAAARQAGTELQPVVYPHTFSDAGAVYGAGAAGRVGCFGHVRDNSHGYEIARLSVFDNVVKTAVQYVIGEVAH
ncbi:MAG: M20/M25/M40 family metallo-hydrolase [Anaerolineae bacterium]|nr:M20/M25/M40 family metallo-hydrolase [Anaerolineae bacterium]